MGLVHILLGIMILISISFSFSFDSAFAGITPDPCSGGPFPGPAMILSLLVPESFRAFGGGPILDPCADLSITKSGDVDPIVAGNTLTYTVRVDNAGPDVALDVIVTDTLPAGVTFVSTSGCAEDPSGVTTCSLGDITSGDFREYDITVAVDSGTTGTITNTASVFSITDDPDNGNNSVDEDTTVNAPGGGGGTTILYGLGQSDDRLFVIDPTDASTISSVTITLAGGSVEGGLGAAIDPTTGDLYAILKASGLGLSGRALVTIDPATGIATLIGDTDDSYAGLEFNAAGTLYGLTGDGAGDPARINILSKIDASVVQFVCDLVNTDDDGESFVNVNGVWIHFSAHSPGGGEPNDYVIEIIDLDNDCASTNIAESGDWDEELIAAAYCPETDQIFVGQDHDAPNDLMLMSPAGVGTFIGEVGNDYQLAGLACTGQLTSPPAPEGVFSIESKSPFIHKIDPNTGDTISSVEIGLPGEDVKGGTGIAFNPADGKLYALLKVGGSDRLLVTINPVTGFATLVGDTDSRMASLTFNPGTLYSVDLDDETLSTISTVDGSVTNLCELDDDDGSGLAFNPDDGFLYYTTDGTFQRIDDFSVGPSNSCDVTELATSPQDPTALAFFNSFLIVNDEEELSSITDAGDDSFIGDLDHFSRGLTVIEVTAAPAGGGKGSTTVQDPNLGDIKNGRGHDNGFCMNQNCINVDAYFNHFPETTVPQGSTQTFSVLVNCPRGANTCNHIEIAGALPDSGFYDYQWAATVDRQLRSENWDLTTDNPYGEIGDVTVTVQTVSQSFVSASFNIPFLIPGSIGTHDGIGNPQENNRHLHVTVWDNRGGSSNYIFNEGVYVDDIYAYPQVETSYDAPIEYEQQCNNENANKRYTCAFDKVRDWTIKNAEEKLKEIYDEHR